MVKMEDRGDESGFQRIRNKCLPGVRIGLILSLLVYFAMVVVGGLGLNQCPVNKLIPIFLVAAGLLGLISKSVSIGRGKLENYFEVKYLETPLYVLELIIFFLGSYWVFSVFQPSYEPSAGAHYCKKSVYLLAFVFLAIVYAILLATIAGFLCFLVSSSFLIHRSEARGERINTQA